MRDMAKLEPIKIQKGDSLTDIFNKCHEVFRNTIAAKDRPLLDGKQIYVPIRWIENKAEIFWHAASLDQKPELSIKPCNNDMSSSLCEENCVSGSDSIVLGNEESRMKCIYRALRIGWIREIIDMYNARDQRVRYWEKTNSKKKNRIYLRYIEDEIDYMVVLEDKSSNRVVLITAFPVFFISDKHDYENDYKRYIQSLEK